MALLTGIILENFKAFKKRQVIPIRPLTLIYGPNSAGKSSIIHALALLGHAFKNNGHAEADRVDLDWSEVRLGGWQNLVHGHDGNATFKIGMQFNASRRENPWIDPSVGADQWEVVWEFGRPCESSEATVTAISALRNGQPEFDGTWDRTKHCWSLVRFPSSLESERLSALQFLRDYTKTGGITTSEESKPAFDDWIASLNNPDIKAQGLFPNSVTDRNSEFHAHDSGQMYEMPGRFLEHLFQPNPNDGSSSAFVRDYSGLQDMLLSGIENINAGKKPTVEETNSLHEIYLEWAAWSSDALTPYDPAAIAFENIIQSHSHLDSVRERPKYALNIRDLPDQPKYRLWRLLIKNQPLYKQQSIREQTSIALETLTRQPDLQSGYQLSMRNRIVEIGGDESRQSITSNTQELAIRNPQGLLLGIEDVGYGISTILPIVTAINLGNHRMISVEQPELHIHPRLQTELGEMFLKSALGKKNTLIVETHSEHLILRILRRIRETAECEINDWPKPLQSACPNGISPEDVAVLYVQPGDNGTEVVEMPVTPDGDFSRPWPGGFFAERSKELF